VFLGATRGYPHVSGGLLFKPSILGGQLGAVILLCEEDPKAKPGMGGMALMGPGVRTVGGRFY